MTRLAVIAAIVAAIALVVSEAAMEPDGAERALLYGLFAGVSAVAGLVGWTLISLHRRFGSLRWTLVGVGVAAVAATAAVVGAAAIAMFLSVHDLLLVSAALAFGVGLGTVLAAAVAGPLTADLRRLTTAAHTVAAGDLTVRTDVRRADELGELASSVDAMVARLAALEEERDRDEAARRDLLAAISHDLRTPLAALQAAIEALQDDVGGDPEHYLHSMATEVGLLHSMVDDLFVLARLQAGDLQLERMAVDLTELTDDAVESMVCVAASRNVDLHLEAGTAVAVDGDPQALARVLRNLVDNAIAHAPPHTTVQVRISSDSQFPTVRVEDEGPGFPADFAERAFDPFTRTDDARNRNTGGAGLGLAIARGLVLAHNGHIWVEPGTGGRIAFTLPPAAIRNDEAVGAPRR